MNEEKRGLLQRLFWTGFTAIDGVVLVLIALFIAQLFIIVAIPDDAPFPLIVALACTLTGALLGFLFAVPRRLRSAPPIPLNSAAGQEASRRESGSSEARETVPRYDASSSLEEISDWLTKIIVGVGLVEAKEIAAALGDAGDAVGTGIFALPAGSPQSEVTGVSMILAFAVVGFLISFLWFRQRLMRAWEESHAAGQTVPLHRLNTAPAGSVQSTDRSELPAGPPTALESAGDESRKGERSESATALLQAATAKFEELRDRPKHADDWARDMFGGSSGRIYPRRTLSASVRPVENSEYFEVSVTFESWPAARGEVAFFLHHTFAEPVRIVPLDRRGHASLRVYAWGAFTVGALADDGDTRLELNLATLPDVPAAFASR